MDWPLIDIIIRFSAISMMILLIIILWRDFRDALPARIGILLCLSVISYLIFEIPTRDHSVNIINILLSAAMSSIYGLFWIFSRTWFNDEHHISWKSWFIVITSIIISVSIWIARSYRPDLLITYIPVRVMWTGFCFVGLWIAWRGRSNDLVEARRKIRTGFTGVVGIAAAAITIIYTVYNIFFDKSLLYHVTISTNIAILIIVYFLILSIIRALPADLFAAIDKPSPDKETAFDPSEKLLIEKLEHHMTHERAYRDEGLTIAALAHALQQQEYRLRRLINGQMGYRNFSAFLNHYRLLEVKQALEDPEQIEVPILTIALDSGFGSLAPFNRAFRQAEGITPTQYRKENKNLHD